MRNMTTKKKIISLATMIMALVLLCGVFSSVFSATAYADINVSDKERYELYGSKVDQNTAIMHGKLDAIYGRLNEWEDKQIAREEAASKKYEGNFKGKKTKAEKELICKRVSDSINTINQQLPGIVQLIKDAQNGGDFDTAGCINTSIATISSIATLCGPYGQIAASILNLGDTILTLAMGGESATSEAAQIEDRLTQKLDEIKNDLNEIQNQINDLSDEISDSTNRIIDELPAALERADDKNRFRGFMLGDNGDFSYNQFRNYIYGGTKNNSSSSTAYYSWLKEALVNGDSDESVRRYYDDIYYAITKNIGHLKDYLAPGDDGIKSIVRTYYDYVSSNPSFESLYGMTPEEATIQFAYEVYQTEQMADVIILVCNNYQYTQMLLTDKDYYGSYNGSFTVHKAEIIDKYSNEIEPRQDEISKQIAKDMTYVFGFDDSYILEETDGTFYDITNSDDKHRNVVSGQTIYLNQIPQCVCDILGLNKYDYSYKISYKTDSSNWYHDTKEDNGYFTIQDTKATYKVELMYGKETISTMTFYANSNDKGVNGSGTVSDPYLISTKEQFFSIKDKLNKYYRLTRTIDFGESEMYTLGYSINKNGGEVFDEFTGTLDGNGYELKNLVIKGGSFTGLFCEIGVGGVVKNITMSNVTVKSSLNEAPKTTSEFYSGYICGINNGKIKNCVVVGDEPLKVGDEPLKYGLSFVLNNESLNRNIYAYVGGIAGKNNSLISCCNVEKIYVKAEANHNFHGEDPIDNKNNVYVGGLTGYNNGLIGYSSVDFKTELTAKAHSILNPQNTVNPYVTALCGGIAGKIGSDSLSNLSNLHSAAKTSGTADFEIGSHWGKWNNNIIQNADSENECYIPRFTDKELREVIVDDRKIQDTINSLNTEYKVDITGGIETSFKANTSKVDVDETKMKITVSNKNDLSEKYKVTNYSVIDIYGFSPYNTSYEERKIDVVVLVRISLENGHTMVIKKVLNCTFEKNKIISVEMKQGRKYFIVDDNYKTIYINDEGLKGLDMNFNCTVNSHVEKFDSSKLSNYTIKNIAADKTLYNYLDKGKIGTYQATITGKYDGTAVEIKFEYVVKCPHVQDEKQYLTKGKVVAPTCAELGYEEWHCRYCNEVVKKNYSSKTDVHAPSYGPSDTGIEPSEATCYREGFTGKVICSVCKKVLDEGHVIPKLEHDYSEIVYVTDKDGNKISHQHKCTHAEEDGSFHYENHQYKVTESVLPKIGVKDEYYVVYTYSCDCGYSKQISDTNIVVDENLNLPTVMVSNGYALKGSDNEVIVYVQLLNNPEIAGANFGIRYDSKLKFKGFEDGNVLAGSIVTESNEVNFGYNFVWGKSDYSKISGNLLKLVFEVPSDAVKGETYDISIVYDIENGVSGGFVVKGIKDPKCFITRDGKITIVERLPGDVNNDGVVDLIDAIIIGRHLVGKYPSIDTKYADVDLNGKVNISDLVIILQSMTGGYGVNLISQEFPVILNGNGFKIQDDDKIKGNVLNVSIYEEKNNTYSSAGLKNLERKGYKFDGWYTKLVGGKKIELTDKVKYFDKQNQQTLYAHWTLNSVILNGNGATNSSDVQKYSYPNDDYRIEYAKRKYEQKYTVRFSDESKNNKKNTEDKYLISKMKGWALSPDGKAIYNADLSYFDLSQVGLGEITLYAIWDNGRLDYPNWNKQTEGYQPVQWYSNKECSDGALLNINYANATIKELAKANKIYKNVANVYAKFDPIIYTINFDANGGTGTKTLQEGFNVDNAKSLEKNTSISRKGYKFSGWALTSNGTVAYRDEKEITLNASAIKHAVKDQLTLYAVWEPCEYTITYNINIPENALKVKIDSKECQEPKLNMKQKKYIVGKIYPEEGDLTSYDFFIKIPYSILGWNFVGWSTTSDGKNSINEIISDGTNIINEKNNLETSWNGEKGSATLYAVWEVDPYTIGKNVNNGDTVSDTIVSDTSKKYIVYNDIKNTPQSKKDADVYIFDWSSCQAGTHKYVGSADKTLDISGATEIYFIGNPDSVYEIGQIRLVGYKENQEVNLYFDNFNYQSNGDGLNSFYGDKDKDAGMKLTINVKGKSSIQAANGCIGIDDFKNLTITGDGTFTVSGGNGTNGADGASGNNGNNGAIGINVDNITVNMAETGSLIVKGGNGGNGGVGKDSTVKGEEGCKRGWPWEPAAGKGGTGGTGGTGGNGGAGGDAIKGNLNAKLGTISIIGGKGGNGGKGGKGGTGGKGGFNAIWANNPGNGGNGGTGGAGGNAGAFGGISELTYTVLSESVELIIGNKECGAIGGAGGDGGDPGAPGEGEGEASWGSRGSRGSNGIHGDLLPKFVSYSQCINTNQFNDSKNVFSIYDNNKAGVVLAMQRSTGDNKLGLNYEMIIKSVQGSDSAHIGGYNYSIQSAKDKIFYYTIYAKIPVGYDIGMHSNAVGNGSKSEWLTDNAGTGKWQWYIGKTTCGSSGNFSTLGFVAINKNGGTADRVDWLVGYSEIFDGTGQNECYKDDFK